MDAASTDSKHIGFHFFFFFLSYFIPLLVLLFSGLVLSIKKKLSHPHYHHHTHCFLQTKFFFCVFHIINNGQSTFFRCLQWIIEFSLFAVVMFVMIFFHHHYRFTTGSMFTNEYFCMLWWRTIQQTCCSHNSELISGFSLIVNWFRISLSVAKKTIQ